ncbi:hypothetical protein GQ457_18G023360 [Hibiscus cannabinus]
MFVYHCSCNMDLHIKCALLTFNIAEKNFGDVQGLAFPTQNSNKEVDSSKCYCCWEPLSNSSYYSVDRGLNLHKKCVELSSEIDHPVHRNHLLTLQFTVGELPCIVCGDNSLYGLSYCCSVCNIYIHVACLPPLSMEDEGHKHPFTIFSRQMSFTCDACGVEGNSVPYMCSICNFLVHKKCISLPPIIKFMWHEHPLFHSYFIRRDNFSSKNWDCVFFLGEVNTEHGSYYCSECHFLIHVDCATKKKKNYSVIESVEKFYENRVLSEDSYIVIERNEGEEATKIKHFGHEHNLMLSDKVPENNEFCDGCTLLILDSFYHCSECNFFLHKKCVEFSKKKYFWFHICEEPLILVTNNIFNCSYCGRVCNGFGYECLECGEHLCLQCPTPLTLTCDGHEHPLSFLYSYRGLCSCCSREMKGAYICKICKFALCLKGSRRPGKVRDKCDEHLLALTYKDDNTYSESHFCDICEKDRNPNHWFYNCSSCETSLHPDCVNGRGKYSFIKSGKCYKGGGHPHPLRFVKKMYYYPECAHCDAPCQGLALEGTELGFEYNVHWEYYVKRSCIVSLATIFSSAQASEKGEMESQHFGHQHPLVFDDQQSNRNEAAHCSRCGEVMSGPSFSCADSECGFYLHKECAEAPSQINHPFHRDHALCLLPNPPAAEYKGGSFICNFCGETGEKFVYHCSCNINLHIKCALFTYNIAEKNFGGLQVQGIAFATKDPSFPTENSNKELESSKCFWCWKPLSDSAYYCLDGGFNLHKKCVELSFEIDHPLDRNHLLTLQFSVQNVLCNVCPRTDGLGLGYCCSVCNISFHMACLPPLPMEDEGHKHPFTIFLRQMSFTCDACGVEENSFPYTCSNCNLLIHKECISLPPIIKFVWHEHPLLHSYFIRRDNSKSKNWDCVVCLEEVNTKHGSYYCSECHFIVHVNCATIDESWYSVIESVEKFYENRELSEDSYIVIERNKDEEATKIKHFGHEHNLMLSDKILDNDEFCDGCTLLILGSFYHCSECSFFLHKKCAEFSKKEYYWYHNCDVPLILVTDNIFKCSYCGIVSNGFDYECHECGEHVCLHCSTPLTLTCEGHEHPLSYLYSCEELCTCCGEEMDGAYICKTCKLALCYNCVTQPSRVRDKCDRHLLALTYKDDNTYSESHFCDICEEGRNPNYWFYYCTICDTSVHLECVIRTGLYLYIKSGKIYKGGEHPHPLRFVTNRYYYPECSDCGDPCKDLALECMELGCEYTVHWKYVAPPQFPINLQHFSHIPSIAFSFSAIWETKMESQQFGHEHPLAFNQDGSSNQQSGAAHCSRCGEVMSGPSFSCAAECGFYLHKECAEPPSQINHLFTVITLFVFCQVHRTREEALFAIFAVKENHSSLLQITSSIVHTVVASAMALAMNAMDVGNICASNVQLLLLSHVKDMNILSLFYTLIQAGKVRNKCDEHPLALTYKDDNTYSESHICDICEEHRGPNSWFYHCTICDTSVEPRCASGRGAYSSIKAGKIYKGGEHPHHLRFVKNTYYYLECSECHAPCKYLALECMEPGCGYIVHWECIRPDLSEV